MLDLLKTDRAAAASSSANGAALKGVKGSILMVPLRKIADNPYQPRGHYDAEHILGLALSIKQLKEELPNSKGLQQVPLARVGVIDAAGSFDFAARHMYTNGQAPALLSEDRGMVQLMFGHSRLRAFMVLAEGLTALRDGAAIGMNFDAVPDLEDRFAMLLEADPDYSEMPLALGFALDHQMWAHAITENSQRKNITAIEEAASIQRAVEEFGLTTEEAGRPFGYARSTTANKLRLLQLPAAARQAVSDGRLTERHGRELLRLVDDPERLAESLDQALKKGWTVRQLASDVDWREASLKDEQNRRAEIEAARQALAAGWVLPGQSEPVSADLLLIDGIVHYGAFSSVDKRDRSLIELGHCGPQCACFGVGYCSWAGEEGYRPDAENAPRVAAYCRDTSCRSAKKQHLPELSKSPAESLEEAAKRQERDRRLQEAERINSDASDLWHSWLKSADLGAMWGSLRFWQVATSYGQWAHYALEKCDSPLDGMRELLRLMFKRTASWESEYGADVHRPEEIEKLIKQLGGSVSQETADQQ